MTRPQSARARRTHPLVVGILVSAAVFVFAACSSDSSDDDDSSGGAPTGGGGSAGAGTGGSAAGSSSGGTSGSGTGGSGTGGSGTGGKSGGAGGLGGSASGGDAGASSGSGGAAPGGSAGVAGNGGRGGNPSSTCPETPPDDASSCSLGLACLYEDCDGDGRTVARCQAGGWDVENGACAAPICEADGCDGGDVCVITTGGTARADCISNPCGTGPVTCACIGCERCTVDGTLSSGIVVTCSS